MLDWLIEIYKTEHPELPIDDVVDMAQRDWDAFESDMRGESPWK